MLGAEIPSIKQILNIKNKKKIHIMIKKIQYGLLKQQVL